MEYFTLQCILNISRFHDCESAVTLSDYNTLLYKSPRMRTSWFSELQLCGLVNSLAVDTLLSLLLENLEAQLTSSQGTFCSHRLGVRPEEGQESDIVWLACWLGCRLLQGSSGNICMYIHTFLRFLQGIAYCKY